MNARTPLDIALGFFAMLAGAAVMIAAVIVGG